MCVFMSPALADLLSLLAKSVIDELIAEMEEEQMTVDCPSGNSESLKMEI